MPPGSNKSKYSKIPLSPQFWPCPIPGSMWCQWNVSTPKWIYSPSLVTVSPSKPYTDRGLLHAVVFSLIPPFITILFKKETPLCSSSDSATNTVTSLKWSRDHKNLVMTDIKCTCLAMWLHVPCAKTTRVISLTSSSSCIQVCSSISLKIESKMSFLYSCNRTFLR